MYPNLRAEMARHNVTNQMLAECLGINPATMSAKLNVLDRLKHYECVKIRNTFFSDKTVDDLFATDDKVS